MKYYGVTIQMKPLQQYFHMVLFVLHVVLTFDSTDEILWCDHLNETSSAVFLHNALYFIVHVIIQNESLTLTTQKVNLCTCRCGL